MKRTATIVVTTAVTMTLAAGCADPDEGAEGVTATPTGGEPAQPPRPQIGTWTELAEMPQARTEFSAVELDGQIYVAGGFHQGEGGPTPTFRYDPESDTWSELAPIPEPRHHAPLAAYDGEVYLVGGFSHYSAHEHVFEPTDTLYIYDVAADEWREGPPLPIPVGAHAVATTEQGTIHVIGGVAPRDEGVIVIDSHQIYDTATQTWELGPEAGLHREHHGAAYLDGLIYVAAGRNGARGNELEAYDTETMEWTRLPDAPTVGRSGVAVVAFQGQIYVFGGEHLVEGMFDHAERYDPQSQTWEEVTPMPVGRHGLGGVALAEGIVVMGGGPRVGVSFTRATEIWRP